MATVAFDAAGSGFSGSGLSTSIIGTETHGATFGSDVFVAIRWAKASGTVAPTRTVTYDGVAMSSLGVIGANNGALTANTFFIELFRLTNAPSGSKTVAATVTVASGIINSLAIGSVSYTGVGSVGSLQSAFGSGTSNAITATSATGHVVINVMAGTAVGALSAYNRTQRSAPMTNLILGEAAGASSVAFTATNGNNSPWADLALDLIPSATTNWTADAALAVTVSPTAAASDVGPALISTLTDNFGGVSTTPDVTKWATSGAAVVDTTNHRLSITNNGSITSVAGYDLTGGAIWTGPVHASCNATLASFQLQVIVSGIVRYGWSLDVTTGIVTAYQGPAATAVSTRTHNSGDWYRIRESGGTVFYDYSADGLGWTNLASFTGGAAVTGVHVALVGSATGGAASLTADADNVNVAGVGASAALAVTAGVSASATSVRVVSASLAVTAASSAAALRAAFAAASLAATASPVGVMSNGLTLQANLAVNALLAAVGHRDAYAQADLSVTVAPSVDGLSSPAIFGGLAVTVTPSGGMSLGQPLDAALAVTVTPVGSLMRTQPADAGFDATATLSGDVVSSTSVHSALVVDAATAGSVTRTVWIDASLTVAADVSADSSTGEVSGASLDVTAGITAAAHTVQLIDAALAVVVSPSANSGALLTADADFGIVAMASVAFMGDVREIVYIPFEVRSAIIDAVDRGAVIEIYVTSGAVDGEFRGAVIGPDVRLAAVGAMPG